MMYLLVSQHVSAIIMPIIRRAVQSRQRLRCTELAVLYTIGVVGFFTVLLMMGMMMVETC
jgi:hypothetical protein